MTIPMSNRRFALFRSVSALILREMTTTYGRSPGGYIWAVLEPMASIALFSMIFSLAFSAPPLGTSFPLFYATGFLPLQIYSSTTAKVGMAIPFSRPLLAYPRVTYVDAILARAILNVMTQVLVGSIIFLGFFAFLEVNATLNFLAIANALMMVVTLSVGIGLVNAFLVAMFPIWATIWAILNRPMFLFSGILFVPDLLSEGFRDFVFWNPVTHVVSEMRAGFYVNYDAVYVSSLYVYSIAAVTCFLGIVLLYRNHNNLLER